MGESVPRNSAHSRNTMPSKDVRRDVARAFNKNKLTGSKESAAERQSRARLPKTDKSTDGRDKAWIHCRQSLSKIIEGWPSRPASIKAEKTARISNNSGDSPGSMWKEKAARKEPTESRKISPMPEPVLVTEASELHFQVTGTPRQHVTTAEEANGGTINTDYDEKEASLSSTSRDTYDNSDMSSEVKQTTHVLECPTNVYFDNKQDAHVGNYLKGKDLDVDIQQVLTAVINAKTEPSESSGQPENLQVDIVDEIDEEVIELEFERAVEKIHSHHGYEMYCPNCSTRVTKVVLRRRIVKKTPVKTDKPVDLLGCLSCFSIFVAAGNKLNPFRMFGWDKETRNSSVSSTQSSVQQKQQTSSFSSATNDTTSTTITSSTQVKDTTSTITSSSTHIKDTTSTITSSTQVKGSTSTGKTYDILSLFRKGRVQVNDTIDKTTDIQETLPGSTAGDRVQTYSLQGSEGDRDLIIDINKDSDGILKVLGEHRGRLGGEETDVTADQQQDDDVHVLIGEEPVQTGTTQFTERIVVCKLPVTVTGETSSISLEVVKIIVYGGLMEIIASLSVVSSGAASGVTTMNILALGLANLVSGLIILGANFRDMKYGENSESEEAVKRYKEILGRKEHFLIHAVVGVLSYIVFGLVPLVTYGLAFRESDDKDYKILAVAGASLLCIIILAIMKTYTRGQHKFSAYFKTVVYYVTFAAAVSGVAYAVGDLASKLMERLGWWDSSPVNALFLKGTKSINPAFVSY